MPAYRTQRGFAMYADIPTEDGNFTVQESSLATARMVWIGLRDERAHLTVESAIRVRDALTEFIAASSEPKCVCVGLSTLTESDGDAHVRERCPVHGDPTLATEPSEPWQDPEPWVSERR